MLIGPHTSKIGSPAYQREQAKKQGWSAIQTHAGNPQTYNLNPQSVEVYPQFEDDFLWVVHSCYPAFVVPKEEHVVKNFAYLHKLVEWCHRVKARYAVVHFGATKDKHPEDVKNAADSYLTRYKDLFDKCVQMGVKILIENVASNQPVNRNLNHLVEIVHKRPDALGWCLDFAHSNAAGVPHEQLLSFFEDPLFRPNVLHCNYPGSLKGSGRDRHGWFHSDITPIPDSEKEDWKKLVRAAARNGIPLIMEGSSEVGGNHVEEVNAIKTLIGEDLVRTSTPEPGAV
jgi:endonuclease IV